MTRFNRLTEEEIRKINELQAQYFSKLTRFFDPPLPEGVPERLEQIVAAAEIKNSDVVLDIGTGTGILIPLIQAYTPVHIYANDLSEAMLESVQGQYPSVTTLQGDVRDLTLPDKSIDVTFINACYSNIIDKHKTFENLRRMTKPGGRLIISHPLGSSFMEKLKETVPFPLDDFPAGEDKASELFEPYGFWISTFINEPKFSFMVNMELPRYPILVTVISRKISAS